jgi:hypothetical protein
VPAIDGRTMQGDVNEQLLTALRYFRAIVAKCHKGSPE